MFSASLITILPTFLLTLILPKLGFKLKSVYLLIALSWFSGIYLFTFLTFFLACFYTLFTTHVLLKATFTALAINEFLFIFFISEAKQLLKTIFTSFSIKPIHIFLIAFCLLFSYLFLSPHLMTKNNIIYTSPIYWDFHWHAAIIQNFVYGDNFPPQNEAFPGIPMAYHFFGDLVMGIYESAGLTLTTSITFSSILFLFFSLIAIIGTAESFFNSKLLGFITVCLAIASSSGHFIYYFAQYKGEPLQQLITGILTNTQSPFNTSFIYGNPFHYDGAMFNLFYFLEERHLFIAPIFLLLCLWITVNRNNFSLKTLTILGALMGGFFYWNVFVALMIPLGLLFVLLFDSNRKTTLALLLGCTAIIGIQYESLKHSLQVSGVYNPDIANYPKFNNSFATVIANDATPTTFTTIVQYYLFAYGLKAILAPIGFFMLWRAKKRFAIILLSFTIPIFIVINTLQISPSGVGENHKFLLNMNIILDLATGYVLYKMFCTNISFKLTAIVFLFFLTISGIIEDMPFINSAPTVMYANDSSSSLTQIIQQNTSPSSIIIGKDTKEIQLAGRKIFVGVSAGDDSSISMASRYKTGSEFYSANNVNVLCSIIGSNSIDYIEFDPSNRLYTLTLQDNLPHFSAQEINQTPVVFLNVQKLCK